MDGEHILFVGRATRAYDEDRVATYQGSVDRNISILRTYKSAYFAFIRNIMNFLYKEMDYDQITDLGLVCGWSNLAKIGDTLGNPPIAALDFQADICCRSLRFEIQTMKPDAIVMMTGNFGIQIFEPVFGANGWHESEYPTKVKKSTDNLPFLVHTYHPERKRGSRAMAQVIACLIASALD